MSFPAISEAIRIFFSYATTASRDKTLFKRLQKNLSISRRNGLIDDSYDSESAMKDTTEQSVEIFINKANIIVLLISSDYFDSPRCTEVEMKRALERKKAGEAYLIPVLLYATNWEKSPLSQYHFLPSDGKPVKRPSSTDMDYALLEVSDEISKVAEELAGVTGIHSRSETQFSLDTIPYGHSRFFTDREDIFTTLHTHFTSVQAFRQTRILALNGMAGSGKTQIAIEYAHLYKHEYRAILWLEATSKHTLNEAIVRLAEPLLFRAQDREDEGHLFDALKRWLQQHGEWLLILDNLRDFQLMDLFIPFQSSGHVLLTTHSQATGDLAHPVLVTQMTKEDSALFLLRRAKIIAEQALRDEASETACTQAAYIVQEVGGLSLALDQAGAYIEEKGCDLARYLDLYREHRMELLAQRGQLARAHPVSVKVTLSLTFKEVAQECPDALELLHLCAFLHPDAIPCEMIEQGASALDGPLHALATEAIALYKAIATLLKFSLVQRCTDPTMLSIHRVVQAILVEELMLKQKRQWAMWAVRLVNRAFPQAAFENWPTCEKYFSQARHCAELITTYGLKQKEAAHLLQRLGSYCYQRAYYQEAEQYLTTALHKYEQARGPDQLAIALTLNNLALLYHKQGKYQEAEEHYQHALVIREQIYEPDHSTIAQTLNNLALLYKDLGKYQQAEELYQRVLLIDEHTLGPDHPDTAASLSNLALVYDEQGKSSLAEPLYQRAFSIEERTLNADHPDLALSLNTRATLYEEQGNYPEAEVFYQRALAIQESSGPDHPDTAQSLNNLAGLYEILGRYQEAERLYQRALNIYRQAFGPEHLDIARSLNNLGYLYRQQERYQEAEVLYQQALTIYERIRGLEHPDTANVLNNLGRLYHLMKKDELAEPLLRRGLDIRERVLGLEHLNTCQSLSALVDLLIHQHLYEQAEPLYQRFLNISRQVLGPENPEVALAQEGYTTLLERINEQKKP